MTRFLLILQLELEFVYNHNFGWYHGYISVSLMQGNRGKYFPILSDQCNYFMFHLDDATHEFVCLIENMLIYNNIYIINCICVFDFKFFLNFKGINYYFK